MQTGKKIKFNFILGVVSEVLAILLGVFVPRFVLTSYGSEINGLIGSITQIYSYIGLLEAGVGVATVQALYRTVAKNDQNATNAVLAATNIFYRKTGLYYLLAILVFSVVYPFLITTDIPLHTIVLIIILNGMGSVIQYFFQAKYFLLFQAEGKAYIKSSLLIFTNLFKNIAKIILMHLMFDVVFVQLIAMFVSLIQMSYVVWHIHAKYPWIDLSVKPDFASISQSSNVLVHEICGLIFNNTDCIVLSLFCGLKTVSVYSMYALLVGMVKTAFLTVAQGFVFSLGQAFHGDKERFIKIYDCYEIYYLALTFALFSIANFFLLPFMKLYTAGVTDINYIDPIIAYLFIGGALLSCCRAAPSNLVNWAGHFKKTQNRAILEASINIVVSLVCVKIWGIYGVLLGTIAALAYRTNDFIIYANIHILKRSPFGSYRRVFAAVGIFIGILWLGNYITLPLDSYRAIFIYCIPVSAVVLSIYFAIVSCCFPSSAKNFWLLMRKVIG